MAKYPIPTLLISLNNIESFKVSAERTISVIIPVYNIADYIKRCIQSVMNQSYGHFECILVDDASTDDSMGECEKLLSEYQGPIQFRILHHQHNRGLSAARNTGTDAAAGDYILYIDGDDAITSDCIEKLRKPLLGDDSIDMVMGDYVLYEEISQVGKHPRNHLGGDFSTLDTVRRCYYDNKICEAAWNKLVRKSFLTNNGITFREGIIWEDLLWMFYVMKHLNHLYLVEDVTYLKYGRPDSICSGTDDIIKLYNYGLVYYEISQDFTRGDSNREARFYFRGFYRNYIHNLQNELNKKTARNFLRELSLTHDTPFYLRLMFVDFLSKIGFDKLAPRQ